MRALTLDETKKLFTQEGFSGFRIDIVENFCYPQYFDSRRNSWMSYVKKKIKYDLRAPNGETIENVIVTYSTEIQALHYILKFLPEEEPGVRRFML